MSSDACIYIYVKYTCKLCGLEMVHCQVPARERNQNVMDWTLKVLALAISRDHEQRSPECKATSISEVYVPIVGASFIGGPIT
jgi:hypothetical protein